MFSNSRQYSFVVLIAFLVHSSQGLPADDLVRSEALKEILQYMNESINPCDDFYGFACGQWPKYHAATEATKGNNVFSLMSSAFDDKLQELLIGYDRRDTDVERKVKFQFRACFRLPLNWSFYLGKLKEIIREFGEMPAMVGDKWPQDKFDWQQTVAEMQYKYGIGAIVGAGVLPDPYNSSAQALYISSIHFALGAKSVYIQAKHEPTRQKYITKISKELQEYLQLSAAKANQTAMEILDFERALVQGLPDEELSLKIQDIYPQATVEDMQRAYLPILDMKRFVNTSWGSIPSFAYYEQRMYLQNLLKVIPQTPKRMVANYVFHNLIKSFIVPYSNNWKEMRSICMANAKESFSTVLENIFYRQYNTKATEEQVFGMMDAIKLAFEDVLNSSRLAWIDADTRQHALEKVHALKLEIPGSEETSDIRNILQQVIIDKEDFVENEKQLMLMSRIVDRVNLYQPPKMSFVSSQLTFTPVNVLPANKIIVPVAILQPHFLFSTSLPNAYNFGRLGSTLAHELVHSFDDGGRMYDKLGNLRDWWDRGSSDAFKQRVECFVDQYQQYEYGGHRLPKRLQQRENIADNGGLRIAYLAYLKWYNDSHRRSPEERAAETFAAGFRYNHKQLFFINYAQVWCADTYDDIKLQLLAVDTHTPAELRATATLSNMEEFGQEFKCPVGSTMNPLKKCQIY